jgi:hypothetical protein
MTALIALRDAGANNQTEIDALMIQLEAHPEAIEARRAAEEEAREYAY